MRIEELDKLTKIVIFCDGDTDNRDNKINRLIKLSFSKNNKLEINKEKLIKGYLSLNNINMINIKSEFCYAK